MIPIEKKIALLIDADNISHTMISDMLAELAKYGTANIRRAYGDWSSASLKGWKGKLNDFAVRPMQQFSYSKGKNATDIALVIDALELLYTQQVDAFCIASSDGDFTPLVMHLKAAGKQVYGFGRKITPEAFVNACTTFLYIDAGENLPESVEAPIAPPPSPTGGESPLSGNIKLVSALRGAVQATAGEDGWAHLGTAGSAVKRQAPIDPRNYGGRKTFRQLFADTGLFVIERAGDGQFYIADKRNKDRTVKPPA